MAAVTWIFFIAACKGFDTEKNAPSDVAGLLELGSAGLIEVCSSSLFSCTAGAFVWYSFGLRYSTPCSGFIVAMGVDTEPMMPLE